MNVTQPSAAQKYASVLDNLGEVFPTAPLLTNLNAGNKEIRMGKIGKEERQNRLGEKGEADAAASHPQKTQTEGSGAQDNLPVAPSFITDVVSVGSKAQVGALIGLPNPDGGGYRVAICDETESRIQLEGGKVVTKLLWDLGVGYHEYPCPERPTETKLFTRDRSKIQEMLAHIRKVQPSQI